MLYDLVKKLSRHSSMDKLEKLASLAGLGKFIKLPWLYTWIYVVVLYYSVTYFLTLSDTSLLSITSLFPFISILYYPMNTRYI